MNIEKFKKHYILSILLGIVAGLMFLIPLIMLASSLGWAIFGKITWSESIPYLWTSGLFIIIGLMLYFIAMLWNILISISRAIKNNNMLLVWVVLGAWCLSSFCSMLGLAFLLPVTFVFSIGLHIWGWFIGAKEI